MLTFVRDNWLRVKMHFMQTQPKNARYPWKGDWVRLPNLWVKGEQARLYLPIQATGIVQAGYIDLNKQMYRLSNGLSEDQQLIAETMLSKGLQWLKEQVEK